MQVVILCGGRGTRLGRQSELRPKPMVRIGERPILWHIMKTYASFGHGDFVLCLGWLSDVIKDYFLNYDARQSDVTVRLGERSEVTVHSTHEEDWSVTLADTGLDTNTGARLKRIERYIEDDTFLLTYGDGVADVDIDAAVELHRSHGKIATVTAVHPPARFGELQLGESGEVESFSEKPQASQGLINGGFFVFDRRVFAHVPDDPYCSLESDLLEHLCAEDQLVGYRHDGFWQCMDTVRELDILNRLWDGGQAPWKRW
ncbi:MAG: glucose-1-phosphate cytidylyltransferase [Acidobacteriota bacterium]